MGVNNVEDYFDITNCISITDTFWVKSVDSKKSWKNVSPYQNSLNKTIAEFSFTGKVNSKYITGSPDLSTGGNFPKCWKKNDDSIYLYKAGTSGACNTGYEPYSEVFAYKLAIYFGFDCVEYKYAGYKDTDVSVCENMCSESIGLIALKDILGNSLTDFDKLLGVYKAKSNIDLRKIIDMLLLDVLVCNTDRHYGNISYYIDNDTQQVLGLASIYDNNLSCIPYYTKDKDLEFYLYDLRAKDGRTFNKLYNLIKSRYTYNLLIKAKKFKFKKIGVARADNRIPLLNKMLSYRISECLRQH